MLTIQVTKIKPRLRIEKIGLYYSIVTANSISNVNGVGGIGENDISEYSLNRGCCKT
jgi:hypothetical protein